MSDDINAGLEWLANATGCDAEKLKQLAREAGPGLPPGPLEIEYTDGTKETYNIEIAAGPIAMPRDTADLASALAEDAGATESTLSAKEGARAAALVSSPTVLAVDRFGLRRGRELSDQWATLAEQEPDIAPPAPVDPTVAADAHTALFEPEPQFSEKPADKHRAAWWRQLMETPEYQRLHGQTCLDAALSELGAKVLSDQWYAYVAEHEPQEGGPEPGSDGESIGDTLARIRSTSRALSEAAQAVDTARDIAAGLGMGGDGGAIDTKALADYYRSVRGDATLRAILAMAGRMRLLCQALQRQKTRHGRDDTVGIELGGDVARLIPSEIAQLACGIPELELLALDRVARRQALCRQYRGLERLGRGPIVIAVDESGSMGGDRIIAAKGLALALAWLAMRQNRWVALVGFSAGTEGTHVAFPPGKVDQATLIDWLTHFYGGGTTLDVPLHELPEVYWPDFMAQGLTRGRTDVVIVTDACVSCPDEMRDRYLKWAAAEQVKTYGIVVGEDDAGDLAAVCDRHWCIEDLDLDSVAVEGVLSL